MWIKWSSGSPNFLRVPPGACPRFLKPSQRALGALLPHEAPEHGLNLTRLGTPKRETLTHRFYAFLMARKGRDEEGEEWESGCLSDDSSFYGPSDRLEHTDLFMPSIKPNQETMISKHSSKNDFQA